MAFSLTMPWSEGEEVMHRLLHVPEYDNPTSTMLTPQASFLLQRGPLLALGTLDSEGRPWTTLWGGTPGFSEPLGRGFIGTRTLVDGKNDPVVQALVGDAMEGKMVQPKDGDKMLSGLAIDLMTRKRVKIAGQMIAGTLREVDVAFEGQVDAKQDQVQLVTKIDQSLGNCPKYLNQYEIHPAIVNSTITYQGPSLSNEGRALISNSDMFFITTSSSVDADTNHRGGPSGFVRIISSNQIVYPEYSGNRLYQSLGNLQMNPKIGITFPDYETGHVLYITGIAEILVGTDAASLLPGSNLAVKIQIDDARFVEGGLPFRGVRKLPSPYNPLVRTLATEGNIKAAISASNHKPQIGYLVKKEIITPSIGRFTFAVSEGLQYWPGQWIALDFNEHLNTGYDHMRDYDPTSLNDDFIRTFTISSVPEMEDSRENSFEITIRKVGTVTDYLFKQTERSGFEVSILGVGGEFTIKQGGPSVTPFIAGGVGITPLLGQLRRIRLSSAQFKLFWTLRLQDLDLAIDTLDRFPELATSTSIFLTGHGAPKNAEQKKAFLAGKGVKIERRRLTKVDLDRLDAGTWYLCAGKPLRKEILSWLQGKNVFFEDFDY